MSEIDVLRAEIASLKGELEAHKNTQQKMLARARLLTLTTDYLVDCLDNFAPRGDAGRNAISLRLFEILEEEVTASAKRVEAGEISAVTRDRLVELVARRTKHNRHPEQGDAS